MTNQLSELPPEIFNSVTSKLAFTDKLRLSSVNYAFRTQLAPQLFHTIQFTNEEASANTALAVVKKHGHHVMAINFEGRASPEDDEEAADEEELGEGIHRLNVDGDVLTHKQRRRKSLRSLILPKATRELLLGNYTPKSRRLQIWFSYSFRSDAWATEDNLAGFYHFQDVESYEQMQQEESHHKWRALMTEAWTALAENAHCRELVVKDLVPKMTTAFHLGDHVDFLGRLESFELSVLGMENGAGWEINTLDGYIDFVGMLDKCFFDHLKSTKTLKLCASVNSPIGLEGNLHVPLALKAEQMSALEYLHLEHVFIGPELVDFILGHAKTLHTIVLKNCLSCCEEGTLAENGITWATFFYALCEPESILSSLTISNDLIPLVSDEEDGSDYDPLEHNESDDVKGIRNSLQEDTTKRLFGYGYLNDKYGVVVKDEQENCAAFHLGDDLDAFETLMTIVRRNADGTTPS